MSFFYTDSGSFNLLEVSGSTILSGSLIVSGATNFGPSGLTGSLFGSASYADSSSYALTASYAANAVSTPAFPFSGSAVITGSLLVSSSVTDVSLAVTGSINTSGSVTASAGFFGTSSFAVSSSQAISASFAQTAISASYFSGSATFPEGLTVTSLTASNAQLTNIVDTTATNKILVLNTANNQIFTTASVGTGGGSGTGFPFSGSGVITGSLLISSSATGLSLQVTGSVNTSGSVTASAGFFGTSSFAVSSSYATSASYVTSASFGGYINFPSGLVVTGSITASAVSASFLTSSNVQLNGLTDTTAANKILVLNTTTNQIFTTASAGGGGTGTGFPFSGSAIITGSLLISSSVANPITITGSTNDFFELEIVNANAGNAASADIVASNDATTDFGNYIDMGINSTTYAGALVGGPSDGYLYFTSSVGELHVGNASTGGTSNVRLFAGGPTSDNTTRVFISASGDVGIGTAIPTARLTVVGNQTLSGSLVVSASQAITASHVQLNNLTDTTSANKVLVLNTATNKIFTTASVGTGGGGSGTGFPFSGSAIITGSLVISSSATGLALTITGSVNTSGSVTSSLGFFGTASHVRPTGLPVGTVSSSAQISSFSNQITIATVPQNALTISSTQTDVYMAFKRNTSTDVGYIGNGSSIFTGFTNTSFGLRSQGDLVFATNGDNVRMRIDTAGTTFLTGSVYSGSLTNTLEISMAVSGTIAANGTTTVALDLHKANFYSVSASAAGTVTWTIANAPPIGEAQTFVIEYTNGGIKTNNWFTNTRWPGGVAPSLTSASANPDMLSFTTDDAGANWRGLLLQRGSA